MCLTRRADRRLTLLRILAIIITMAGAALAHDDAAWIMEKYPYMLRAAGLRSSTAFGRLHDCQGMDGSRTGRNHT